MSKDKSLIVSYLLDGNGGGKIMSWEDIENWSPKDGVLWVHLNYTTKKSKQWLNKESGLDLISAKCLYNDVSRPRATFLNQGLLLCLRSVNLNPGQDPEDMVSIRLWSNGNIIITTRNRPLLSIVDIRTLLDEKCGPKNSAEFIRVLNDHILERISDVVESIDEQVDQLETEVLSDPINMLRPKISDLRRQCISMHRYLTPQREALFKLSAGDFSFITKGDMAHIRESNEHILRYIESLDASRERAAITQEELETRMSEQINSRMYVLSIFAAVFMPLSFITGLLGINVGGIPGAEYPWAFSLVCLVLTVLMFLILGYFYRKKWV